MSVTAQCQPFIPRGRPPPKFKAPFQSSLGLTIDALKDISPALTAREIEQANGRIAHNKFGKLLILYILNNLNCISQIFFLNWFVLQLMSPIFRLSCLEIYIL